MNKTRNLFEIAADIECEAAPMDEVESVLCLLEEQLRNTARWLDPTHPYTATLVQNRLYMLLDTLNMIRRDLGAINKGIHRETAQVYEQHNRESRQTSN